MIDHLTMTLEDAGFIDDDAAVLLDEDVEVEEIDDDADIEEEEEGIDPDDLGEDDETDPVAEALASLEDEELSDFEE